jgi:hypothetical protein
MYCVNCGSLVNNKLNYCSGCGAKLAKPDAETEKTVSRSLAESLGYIGVFGLVGFIFVLVTLVKNGIGGPDLMGILFLYLAALFGVCFLVLRQIKNFSDKPPAAKSDFADEYRAVQIGAPNTAQLEESKQAPISVTDNTTRTLDEVLVKRN